MEKTLRPDLFLSLHCNAATNPQAHGFEVWTSPGQRESDRVAEEIIQGFQAAFPYNKIRKDLADGDSDKEARFRVLVGTVGPAVLVEFGFLTNPEESLWLRINRARLACVVGAGAVAWWEAKHGSA